MQSLFFYFDNGSKKLRFFFLQYFRGRARAFAHDLFLDLLFQLFHQFRVIFHELFDRIATLAKLVASV
jgi:hypothetical protein